MVVTMLHPQLLTISDPPKMKSFRTHSKCKKNRRLRPQYVSDQVRPTASPHPKPHDTNALVMGKVRILKRGEKLTETTPDRRTKTETVEKESSLTFSLPEKVDGLYAGYSMSAISPPPSSVPLPIFITKKIAAVSDATRDLRKMLQIDFP